MITTAGTYQSSGNLDPVMHLLHRWRDDVSGTYHTWFLWDQRLKNFRSIRRGISAVVNEIEADSFGNLYKGSSLETVVRSIAEQRQIFKGADHAFLWKPKMRIPDIYENRDNQVAFARFLNSSAFCTGETQLIEAIHALDRHKIKGLGPAAANLLYFLHPTLASPFNTSIVNGFNKLTGAKVKLGKWDEYLAMRRGIIALNKKYRELLSNDLGAIAGLLFELGSGRYLCPPGGNDAAAIARWKEDLAEVRSQAELSKSAVMVSEQNERSHTEVQACLRDLGIALGFRVWIASNDRNRTSGDRKLSDNCLSHLPEVLNNSAAAESFRLIDVLWLESAEDQIAAAFEVEHTTSIYSGIVRMLDLALGLPEHSTKAFFLVAPDAREQEVRAQLNRPAFSRVADLNVRFIPYSDLDIHRDAIVRFGQGLKPIEAIARNLM